VTPVDERVAAEATELLVQWGHSDLSVTGSQIVRWRSADVFELPPGPRQGRGNLRQYQPNAAEVAARFAIVLSRSASLDEAVLSAMSRDVDVAHDGVTTAFDHFVYRWLPMLQRAKKPTLRRSERFAFLGPRQAIDLSVRNAMLDLTTDREPTNPIWAELVVERFAGPEAVGYYEEAGDMDRLRSFLKNLSLVALRRAVRDSSQQDLRWAAKTSRTLMEYARAVSDYFDATGRESSDPKHRIMARYGRTLRRLRISDDLGLAFLAPAVLLFLPNKNARRDLALTSEALGRELPVLRTLTSAARDFPEKWRPCLGPGGLAVFAALHQDEADAVLRQLREWLDVHPEGATLVSIQEVPQTATDPKKAED
jgi:hypothetical protein